MFMEQMHFLLWRWMNAFSQDTVMQKYILQCSGMKMIRRIRILQQFKKSRTNLSLLKRSGMLSVNQMNAQCKLLDVWKSINLEVYPYQPTATTRQENEINTRACTTGKLTETSRTKCSQNTFKNDAIHIWNKAPMYITDSKSLYNAKKAIKSFVFTLPIWNNLKT